MIEAFLLEATKNNLKVFVKYTTYKTHKGQTYNEIIENVVKIKIG